MKKVTFDTNIFPLDDSLFKNKPIEIAVVTVTDRELENHTLSAELMKFKNIKETGVWDESRWDQTKWGPVILETAVLNESRLGECVLGSNREVDVFEKLLKIISSGSFPKSGQRSNLNRGQRHQLRDAMILTAHIRDRRHIFVTEDIKGFIGRKGEIRNEIEKLFKTKIMTKKEFTDYLSEI